MKRILVIMIVLTVCMSLLFTYAIHIPFSYATGSSPTTHPVINTTNSDAVKTSDGLELFYTVTVEKGKDTVHVDIKIQSLSQSDFEIGFYGLSNDAHGYVKNLIAHANESQLNVEYTGQNIWAISTRGESSINIGYDLAKIIPYGGGLPYVAIGSEVAVFVNDLGGILIGRYFFLVPVNIDVKNIKIKFDLPADWQIVCPYVDHETYFEVPKVTNNLINDFIARQGIYFGKMKFYSEEKTGNCTVKFGVLEADQGWNTKIDLSTQEDVDFYAQRTAAAVEKFTEIFGENPYPVIAMYANFCSDESEKYRYPGTREIAGGYQYWPPSRYDETVGHLFFSWVRELWSAPIGADDLICKGIGESYFGNKIAYEITSDKHYLGKLYSYYLVYKGALGTKYFEQEEKIKDAYYKGAVVGLYLDDLIQKETNNSKSLYDVFGYLYKKYKNTDIQVGNKQLQEAVDAITGQNNSVIFNKYVYGDEEIPVQDIIRPYEDSLEDFLKILESDAYYKQYHGYSIPFFIDIETALVVPGHIPFQLLCKDHYNEFAKYVLGNYDVNALTKEYAEASLSKLTGEDCTGFFNRWKDSCGELSLEEMKEWLKSYLPYSPTNLEATFKNDSVNLKWNQVEWRYPNYYYEVTGYTIYRGTPSGEEVLIATVGPSTSTYTDTNIEVDKTYYYYVRTIENLFEEMTVYSDPSTKVTVVCADTTPPRIEIDSPADNSTVDTNTIRVSGMAIDDESGIDKVTVNGSEVSVNYGFFSKTVNLIKGINTITIIALDKEGNTATKTITVTYTLPAQETIIALQPDNSYITVNGVSQEIDLGRGTKPVIIPEWSRTVVPIRAIVEALGGTISWDGIERKVTINFKETIIELWIDNPKARVNGAEMWIDTDNHDVKPIIINDRTMLPLRFVTENLGCDVDWDPDTKTITITYGG